MNLYQLLLFTRFADSSDEEESESAAVAKDVGKSTGDETDDEEKLFEEDDKDVRAIGKNLIKFLDYVVSRPLLEVMLVKLTILYVTTLVPILLDLPVFWP